MKKSNSRVRKTAKEILRKFYCKCGKSYGLIYQYWSSDGSLQSHVRLKHLKEKNQIEEKKKHLSWVCIILYKY